MNLMLLLISTAACCPMVLSYPLAWNGSHFPILKFKGGLTHNAYYNITFVPLTTPDLSFTCNFELSDDNGILVHFTQRSYHGKHAIVFNSKLAKRPGQDVEWLSETKFRLPLPMYGRMVNKFSIATNLQDGTFMVIFNGNPRPFGQHVIYNPIQNYIDNVLRLPKVTTKARRLFDNSEAGFKNVDRLVCYGVDLYAININETKRNR